MLRRQCVCLIFSKNIRFIRPDGRRSLAPRIRSRNCRGHYDRAVAVLLALIGWLKPHSFLNAGAGRQDPHVEPSLRGKFAFDQEQTVFMSVLLALGPIAQRLGLL